MRHAVAIAILVLSLSALADDFPGRVRSTDGDSANINVRLKGIDAPEAKQRCDPGCWPRGKEAAVHLKALTDDALRQDTQHDGEHDD